MKLLATICIVGIIVLVGAYFLLDAVLRVIHAAAEAENKILEEEREIP